jgi:TRAP transporter TAXI family solute receptor
LYVRLVVPRGTYPGITSDVAVVGVSNALVVDETMSEDVAFAITRVLFERRADLAAIHPEASKLRFETAITGSPAPFHPGAIRYYRERGVWK